MIDIKKLYEQVRLCVKDNTLEISTDEGSVFSPVRQELAALFQAVEPELRSITVFEAALSFDEEKDIFRISSNTVCKITENISFQSIEISETGLQMIVLLQDHSLDSNSNFILKNVRNILTTEYGAVNTKNEITGEMEFGSAKFVLSGILDDAGYREYRLKDAGEMDAGELLNSCFTLMGLPSFLPTETSVNITKLDAVFEENTREDGEVSNESFGIETVIDVSLRLSDYFCLDSLTLFFERFGEEYSLGVGGKVQILELTPFVFFARYEEGGSYLFGIRSDNDQSFNFNDITKLTGVEDTGSLFPEELTTKGGLTLSNLIVRTDFHSIQTFLIEIGYGGTWTISKNLKLSVGNVKLKVILAGEEKYFEISAVAGLFGKDILIAGSYRTGESWSFYGELASFAGISIQDILDGVSELADTGKIELPLDVRVTGLSVRVNLAGEFEFCGSVLAGDSKDENQAKLFQVGCGISVKRENGKLGIAIQGKVLLCGVQFDISYAHGEKEIISACLLPNGEKGVSLKELLALFGPDELADALPECFNLTFSELAMEYDFTDANAKKLSIDVKLKEFSVHAGLTFQEQTDYDISIRVNTKLDIRELPLAGDLLESVTADTSVSEIALNLSKKKGLVFQCKVFGEAMSCVLKAPAGEKAYAAMAAEDTKDTQTRWISVQKNISVFRLNRLGIALRGKEIGFVVDGALQVAPFELELMGVGISADVPDFTSVHFLMEGFGVSFESDSVRISGAFRHAQEKFSGEIEAAVSSFSIVAVGTYEKQSLMAYALLSYPLGGPPCFYITGLAAAFGYNKKLRLPSIEEVPQYPLVAAAMGKENKETLISTLETYISTEKESQFLAAGVKFTSFQIVRGFLVLTVAFGKKTEIGLLGLADIVMPPQCDKTPIARAQLALKAAVYAAEGLASCEAQLTPSSYIFSEKCVLTGGFAFYLWFGGSHKGDFVVTLGGYHPAYKKPAHYPDVPRLGFRWDVLPKENQLVLSGQLYFALTPSAIMAGGKLSAVYTDGNLRAYFIAYADFLLQWKPFYYNIQIGIALGASYRVDFWFVHHTFTVELSARLHIWGPEFGGRARISWFIISFTIPFGESREGKAKVLKWTEFKESFLAGETQKKEKGVSGAEGSAEAAISVLIQGQTGETAVRADNFSARIRTTVPVKEIAAAGKREKLHDKDMPIQPMNGTLKGSLLTIKLIKQRTDSSEAAEISFNYSIEKEQVPSALWGEKNSGRELESEIPMGVCLLLLREKPVLFPEEGEISEEVLTEAGKLQVKDAYQVQKTPETQEYLHTGTIEVFRASAESSAPKGSGLLKSLGLDQAVCLKRFAENADNLFDDDILVGSVTK